MILPFVETRKNVAEARRAGDGIEFVAAFGEAGRCVEVVVGAERDNQVVGLKSPAVGGDAPLCGIDCRYCLLEEAHARLDEVAIGQPDRFRGRPAEHHVEFRVSEGECVALVDQGDVGIVAERLGQKRAQLKAAEPCTKNEDASFHKRTVQVTRAPSQAGEGE